MEAPAAPRVLVVDDSPLIRRVLTHLLTTAGLEVVGTAADPYEARDQVRSLNPDVITLDIEMPKMDGITFLKNLMRARPIPVVMISTLTERGADATIAALEAGAVDFFTKPRLDQAGGLEAQRDVLAGKVRAAARANVRFHGSLIAPHPAALQRRANATPAQRLIAIGSSTGGTEAVAQVLHELHGTSAGVVITQHIPEMFSARWAERLDKVGPLRVTEAVDGAPILEGHGYVAHGGRHLRVERGGGGFVCRVGDDAPVNGHRPSVEALFDSVLSAAGKAACAAILTGMGDDGAAAMLRLRKAGLFTVAQDEASSVVWGMPGQAVRLGAALEVLPLSAIGARLSAASR